MALCYPSEFVAMLKADSEKKAAFDNTSNIGQGKLINEVFQ
jgi:hypothetical protein